MADTQEQMTIPDVTSLSNEGGKDKNANIILSDFIKVYADTMQEFFDLDPKLGEELRTMPIHRLRDEYLELSHKVYLAKHEAEEIDILNMQAYGIALMFRATEKAGSPKSSTTTGSNANKKTDPVIVIGNKVETTSTKGTSVHPSAPTGSTKKTTGAKNEINNGKAPTLDELVKQTLSN